MSLYSTISFALVLTLFSPPLIFCENLSIDKIMDQREQEASGVDRLSPQERQALEQWVSTWTQRVIQQAPTYHPSMTIPQWVNSWPGYANPKQSSKKDTSKEKQEDNQKIFRNHNGSVLELYDGSVWNITAIDQPIAKFWGRGQRITITKNPRDIVRPFFLTNQQKNEQVGGTKGKGPNPEGQRAPDSPAYFSGASTISSITPDGITITLHTGKIYIVAPTGQQLVQATWNVQDRVRVEKSSDAAYPFSIKNLDSGNSVLANPPNKESSPSYYKQS